MLKLENLDDRTRQLMDEEFRMDRDNKKLYFSPRLSEKGENVYQNLLGDAILHGTELTLAQGLHEEDAMKRKEKRMSPIGGMFFTDVPEGANKTLAEGEFNRYYIRAVCRQALDRGIKQLHIFNVNPDHETPDEYKKMLGRKLDPHELLEDLRQYTYINGKFGISAPQSGLMVRFV